jgi:hypothetical protein
MTKVKNKVEKIQEKTKQYILLENVIKYKYKINVVILKAMVYEKDGFTWSEEPLANLIKPERILKIKEEYIKRTEKSKNSKKSDLLMDILDDSDTGCASCFI